MSKISIVLVVFLFFGIFAAGVGAEMNSQCGFVGEYEVELYANYKNESFAVTLSFVSTFEGGKCYVAMTAKNPSGLKLILFRNDVIIGRLFKEVISMPKIEVRHITIEEAELKLAVYVGDLPGTTLTENYIYSKKNEFLKIDFKE